VKFERKPLDADVERDPTRTKDVFGSDRERLEKELRGAVEATGVDQVRAAFTQVMAGEADPTALLDWIDQLREPMMKPPREVEAPLGIRHDFEADSEFAFGIDAPDAVDDPAPEATPDDHDLDLDHYVFMTRRRRLDEGEDEDSDEGDAGGEAGKAQDRRTKPA
jgi:hypothetical protein